MIHAAFANSGLVPVRPRKGVQAVCRRSSSLFGGSLLSASPRAVHAHALWCMKIGIFFSTATSNTTDVAELIKEKLGSEANDPQDIGDVAAAKLLEYDTLIVGAPTWNTGAEDQRSGTDWDDFLYASLPDMDLAGKSVACFGLGDAAGYGDYFCDALEELHDCFQKSGARMVGYVDPSYVEFDESKSVRD
eukprot:IDg10404t1